MEDMSKAAFILSQSVAALAKIEGMKAENMQREALGQSMAYSDDAFFNVIQEYGIDHNSVIAYLNNAG